MPLFNLTRINGCYTFCRSIEAYKSCFNNAAIDIPYIALQLTLSLILSTYFWGLIHLNVFSFQRFLILMLHIYIYITVFWFVYISNMHPNIVCSLRTTPAFFSFSFLTSMTWFILVDLLEDFITLRGNLCFATDHFVSLQVYVEIDI